MLLSLLSSFFRPSVRVHFGGYFWLPPLSFRAPLPPRLRSAESSGARERATESTLRKLLFRSLRIPQSDGGHTDCTHPPSEFQLFRLFCTTILRGRVRAGGLSGLRKTRGGGRINCGEIGPLFPISLDRLPDLLSSVVFVRYAFLEREASRGKEAGGRALKRREGGEGAAAALFRLKRKRANEGKKEPLLWRLFRLSSLSPLPRPSASLACGPRSLILRWKSRRRRAIRESAASGPGDAERQTEMELDGRLPE